MAFDFVFFFTFAFVLMLLFTAPAALRFGRTCGAAAALFLAGPFRFGAIFFLDRAALRSAVPARALGRSGTVPD